MCLPHCCNRCVENGALPSWSSGWSAAIVAACFVNSQRYREGYCIGPLNVIVEFDETDWRELPMVGYWFLLNHLT